MAFWEAGFGGQYGGQYRLRVNVDVIAQEVGNNRSLIRYNAWMEQIGSSAYSVYNNNGINAHTNINGYNPARGGTLSLNGPGQRRYIAQNEDYWIGHDANGDANPYFGADFDTGVGSVGYAATGGNFWMPHIDRTLDIPSWSLTGATEKSFTANISTDATADLVDYSLNGGSWTRGYTGNYTNVSFGIGGLLPNTTYSLKLRARKADSGLYTETGLKSITTLPVNITGFTNPFSTDTTVDLKAVTNYIADRFEYRLQGSSTWIVETGDFTTKTITVSGLTPNITYVYEARARHKDSQTYTPTVTTNATTVYPIPLQATNMSPSNGVSISDLTPTLSWTYNATGSDFQSAYQVRVYDENTGATMWDSGKVTSLARETIIPNNSIANPSFETDTTGWTGYHATIAQNATQFIAPGTKSLAVTVTQISPDSPVAIYSMTGLIVGQEYTFSAYVRTSAARNAFINSGQLASSYTQVTTVADTWTRISKTAIATATTASLEVGVANAALNEVFYVDNAMLDKSSTLNSYNSINLLFNKTYQWEVKTWGGIDTPGPYSGLALFKTSKPPVVVITAPTDAQTIQTDAPTITWTYADPEATPQIGFIIYAFEIQSAGDNSGSLMYQQEVNFDATTSYTMPPGILLNGKRYLLRVASKDSDSVYGYSADTEIFIQFVAPAAPNAHAELSEDNLFTRITTSTNTPGDDAFEADVVRMYKREVGKSTWTFIDEIASQQQMIDSFESSSAWVSEAGTSHVALNNNTKQGDKSLDLYSSVSGTYHFHKDSSIGSIVGAQKIRLWVRVASATNINSITFRLGADATNYYQFIVPDTSLTSGVWKSIEVSINSLTTAGSPSLSNINYEKIIINSDGVTVAGDVLIDSWRVVEPLDSLFVYDYELQNNTSYEYAATAYSSSENLESAFTQAPEVITVVYNNRYNTFLVPIGNESNSVVSFMEGTTPPAWTTNVSTSYLYPVGSQYPVAYSMSKQKYRKGSITILFLDECKNGLGIKGPEDIEEIMNVKPILLRTWWGRNYYVSIDGTINVERRNNIGWQVSFSFTEIANVQ
jgi:hypothetical protein